SRGRRPEAAERAGYRPAGPRIPLSPRPADLPRREPDARGRQGLSPLRAEWRRQDHLAQAAGRRARPVRRWADPRRRAIPAVAAGHPRGTARHTNPRPPVVRRYTLRGSGAPPRRLPAPSPARVPGAGTARNDLPAARRPVARRASLRVAARSAQTAE